MPTSTRSRRAACRTCWSAASRSTDAKKWRRCGLRSPRSNGPTTNSRCSRRCAVRCSRSTTRRCSSIGSRQRVFHPFRPLEQPPPELQPVVDALALLKQLHGAAQLPAGGRHGDRPAERHARTRRLRASGPPVSRRWRTFFTSRSWRASTRSTAACRFAASSTNCATRPMAARRRRRRFSKRAATACD